MKATLKFDLPDDSESFELAFRAQDMYIALDEIRNYLRSQVKHADPPDDIDRVYERFFQIINDHNIEL